MGFFSFLDFGGNKIKESLLRGAVIIDVRSPGEYDRGKYPRLQEYSCGPDPCQCRNISKSLNKPIIIVCFFGFKKRIAKQILKENGVKKCIMAEAGNGYCGC